MEAYVKLITIIFIIIYSNNNGRSSRSSSCDTTSNRMHLPLFFGLHPTTLHPHRPANVKEGNVLRACFRLFCQDVLLHFLPKVTARQSFFFKCLGPSFRDMFKDEAEFLNKLFIKGCGFMHAKNVTLSFDWCVKVGVTLVVVVAIRLTECVGGHCC